MEITSGPTTSPLNLGEWYQVYVSFLSLQKNQGYSKIIINGASGGTIETWISNARDYSLCTDISNLKFGNGFIGELKRIQVYSPAAFIENPCKIIFVPLLLTHNPIKLLVIQVLVKLKWDSILPLV